MPVKVTRYKCDYCKKTYTRSYSAYQHGSGCYHNPKNRTCRTCKYNEEQSYTVYNRNHGGDPGSTDLLAIKAHYEALIASERSKVVQGVREWAIDNYTEKSVGLWIEMPELLEKLDSMEPDKEDGE